jgi:hypothetical protein
MPKARSDSSGNRKHTPAVPVKQLKALKLKCIDRDAPVGIKFREGKNKIYLGEKQMRKVISIAIAAFFVACVMPTSAHVDDARYMAFCNDGDGALSRWEVSRDEAYIAGRDHERANRGHRWEVMIEHGKAAIRPASCSIVSDDTERPDTVKIVNTCGACRIFKVTRQNADGSVKSREFKVKPNGQRHFRKIADAKIVVEGEIDCPGN